MAQEVNTSSEEVLQKYIEELSRFKKAVDYIEEAQQTTTRSAKLLEEYSQEFNILSGQQEHSHIIEQLEDCQKSIKSAQQQIHILKYMDLYKLHEKHNKLETIVKSAFEKITLTIDERIPEKINKLTEQVFYLRLFSYIMIVVVLAIIFLTYLN